MTTPSATGAAATIRHGVSALGGALVSAGVMSQTCATDLVSGVSSQMDEAGGGVAIAVAVGWSLYQKWAAAKA